MGKIILFSAIGGTDPVASSTEKDGSMLHICRVYQPEEVYLYFSKEMLERHRQDNRYLYCIEKLGEHLNHHFEVTCIEREELVDVQDYNFYFEDFRKEVEKIQESMDSDDRLLVNIASGTPAMKSGLLFLAAMADYKFEPIQVSTPSKSINYHAGKQEEYDAEYYWELNQDNVENFENRCKEEKCPNLVILLKKNILKKHILAYDYPAALRLAEEIREDIPENGYELLKAAVARLQLDFSSATSICQKIGVDIFPIKESGKIALFEYALSMQIKILHREYGDFIRAISPLITDLLEMILLEQCSFDVKKYCITKENNTEKWKIKKLETTEEGRKALDLLNQEWSPVKFWDNTAVSAGNLVPLIEGFSDNQEIKIAARKIREIEANVRNIAAHQIVSITEEKIKKIMGDASLSVDTIYGIIKKLIIAAKIKVKKEDWDSYSQMNAMLITMLELE